MERFYWLDHLPDSSIEGGVALANLLYWNITTDHGKGGWIVRGGEKILLWSESRETVDAFLYGLGLAYAALPEEIFERLRENLKRVVE